MAKATIAERLAAGLIALGYREVECNSRKYRQFDITKEESDGQTKHYRRFVGKAGALRGGRTTSGSISYDGTAYKTLVLTKGDIALSQSGPDTKALLDSLGGDNG